jgi:hypothetical protein
LVVCTRLQGVSRRTQVRTTVRHATGRPAPDLVERQFEAAGITAVPTEAGFLCLD